MKASMKTERLEELRRYGALAEEEAKELTDEVGRLRKHFDGPQPDCTHCGCQMIWDDLRMECPAWVCPSCLTRRLREALQQ